MRHPTMRAAVIAAILFGTLGAGPAPARVLEGKVVDRAGHPVAGATVGLVPSVMGEQEAVSLDKASLMRGLTPSRHAMATTTTGKDGAFRFDHVLPFFQRILVRVRGAPAATGFVHPNAGVTRVRLTVGAGVRIDGEVVDGARHPVDGARVLVRSGLFDLPPVTTDAKGRFHVHAPIAKVPYLADVSAAGHGRVRIGLVPGKTNHIVVGEGRIVSGIVRAGGKPVAGATVRANGGMETTTGADGTFTLAGLAPGRVALFARRDRTTSKLTMVDARTSDVHGIEIDFAAPRSLEVHVLDTDGKPVAGATVRLGRDVHGNRPERRTDAHGVATFGSQPGYTVEIVADAPGRARTWAQSSDSGPTIVRLPPGSDLHLRLDAKTAPGVLKRLEVQVMPSDGMTPGLQRKVALDDAGKATVRGLARGHYEVWVTGPVPAAAPLEVAVPHRGVVALHLAKGGRVSGRIVDAKGRPIPGMLLYLSSADVPEPMSGPRPHKTGDDGRFVFDGVGAGRYRVRIYTTPTWLPPWPPPVVEAGARGLTITMRRARTIGGVVVDASGTPLGGAMIEAHPDVQDPRQRRSYRAVADATGHFTVKKLPGGRYRLEARSGGARSAPVTARAGAHAVRIVVGGDSH